MALAGDLIIRFSVHTIALMETSRKVRRHLVSIDDASRFIADSTRFRSPLSTTPIQLPYIDEDDDE